MKTININQKRNYTKPQIKSIRIDNKISIVMMSPPVDPELSIQPEYFSFNPFKLPNI